jgi:putative Mn2+ efflux pump MntP
MTSQKVTDALIDNTLQFVGLAGGVAIGLFLFSTLPWWAAALLIILGCTFLDVVLGDE